MTSEGGRENEKSTTKVAREITFKCQSCGQYKPLKEMMVVTRFFPPLVVCQDCEKEMR